MDEFLKSLGSTYWWISVVIVGILINLASNFLQKNLDMQLSSVSKLWKKKSDERKRKRQQTLELLKNNPHEQLLASISEIRRRTRGIFFAVIGVAFLGIGAMFQGSSEIYDLSFATSIIRELPLLMGALALLFAIIDHQMAVDIKHLVTDSHKGSVKDNIDVSDL